MRDRLRLLLTVAVVSTLAVVLAVWVNAPAQLAPGRGPEPAVSPAAPPARVGEFVSPVEDGVFPSAVVSEDMRKALERRAAAAAAESAAPAAGTGIDPESPREIGEFLDPDAPLAASSTAAPRSIGEFLDPAADAFEPGAGSATAIGRFLDPDQADSAPGDPARPVSIGRPIDPDGVAMQPPAGVPTPIEIGEFIEVDAP